MVSVKPTSDAEVARSAVTRGNAGVYMSVANGGTADCRANVTMSSVVTLAGAVVVDVIRASPAPAAPSLQGGNAAGEG